MEHFTEDFLFDASLTTYKHLADTTEFKKRATINVDSLVKYLHDDQDRAVILHGSVCNLFGKVVFAPELYVLRGASGELGNFYFGAMPPEDPNDAEGGYLTAEEALRDATAEYYA